MRKKKRSDPSVLTAAIREAAEKHERASKRVAEQLEYLQQRMRDSDPPEDDDTMLVDVDEAPRSPDPATMMRTIREDPRCDAYMDGDRPAARRCAAAATIPSGLCLEHCCMDRVYIAVGGSADSPSLLLVRGKDRRARQG